jgi:hypothetical protein
MCSVSQLIPQLSQDLDIYLPSELDSEETLLYQSPEMLIHSINFDPTLSSHRLEFDLFDLINDDVKAALSLINNTRPSINNNNFDTNNITDYFCEQSTVVPHVPNLSSESIMNVNSPLSPSSVETKNISPANSPSHQNQFNIQKFLVFDPTTGRERRPLLHEFLRRILDIDEYSHIAEYTDRQQGIFKVHKRKALAELWRHIKGRNSDNGKFNFTIKNFIYRDFSFFFFRNEL